MSCPACSAEMADGKRCGATVKICPACGACWSTRGAVQAVLDGVERRFTATSLAGLRTECAERRRAGLADATSGPAYLKCPDCGVQMHRKAFAPHAGIVADLCAPHGLLLKRGQLEVMSDYVARGGEILVLEATREQLEDELAELSRKVKDLERAHAAGGANMFFAM